MQLFFLSGSKKLLWSEIERLEHAAFFSLEIEAPEHVRVHGHAIAGTGWSCHWSCLSIDPAQPWFGSFSFVNFFSLTFQLSD